MTQQQGRERGQGPGQRAGARGRRRASSAAAARARPPPAPADPGLAGPAARRPRRPGPGARQRLRRQRRGRHHDLLDRRGPAGLRAPVGDPGQPGRPVLHPGGGRATRPRDGQGTDGPDPRALGRALGRLRRAPHAHRQPGLDRRRVRRDRLRAGALRRAAPGQRRRRGGGRGRASSPLGSYSRVQYLFVGVGILVSAAYVISAFMAGPDWGVAAQNLVIPHLTASPVYWLAVVGHRRHHDHAVGPGVHPVVRGRQGPAPGRPAGQPPRRLRAGRS